MEQDDTSRQPLPSLKGGVGGGSVWTCLCAGDILLRREGATLSLPVGKEPPVELQPRNKVTTLQLASLTGGAATMHVVRLDRPVANSEGLEMMNLRASFDVLSTEEYNSASDKFW